MSQVSVTVTKTRGSQQRREKGVWSHSSVRDLLAVFESVVRKHSLVGQSRSL